MLPRVEIQTVPRGLIDQPPSPNSDMFPANDTTLSACHFLTSEFELEEDDMLIIENSITSHEQPHTFTAYKKVDKKVRPVSTTYPIDCTIKRQITHDPMETLPVLPFKPPGFKPTKKIDEERLKILQINSTGFLWPEEEALFIHIMMLNEAGIAFVDEERGTLNQEDFADYIIPTVPHTPWEYRNIPIPRGIEEKVLEVLNLKIAAGVYEQSSSSYRSRWFVVMKKNGKLRIVHDLQPLNKVTVRDAGTLPIIDDFVDGFAGRQCYTVFDLFWGFDARKIDPISRPLTAFMTPLGMLQITSLPTGYTNSPAEFQKCMVIILQDEIPKTANVFIDDLPIKGPATQYLDKNGQPEVLKENPGIRRFIWEHAQDVHRIMHKIVCAGATFAATKAQICLPEVMIVGQQCNAQGRSPDSAKVEKVLKWPLPSNPKEVRQFLGLCGTVRIWIQNYSKLVKPISELYHKDKEFEWTPRRIEAFEHIKSLVASAPALRPIDYTTEDPVILAVDSSYEAAGMILSQETTENGRKVRHPARFGSVPMGPSESRYSQPKLELFGLYRALRSWRLYIIGVKNLKVEVDAQYIKGMLNEPDLQPNAAINRWIQGILMFTFELVHVPAERHKGPDALSRRPRELNEIREDHDDSWLDEIVLLGLAPKRYGDDTLYNTINREPTQEALVFVSQQKADQFQEIRTFLTELKLPLGMNSQQQRRFIANSVKYFVSKDNILYRKNKNQPPLRVITGQEEKLRILEYAHDKLGHRGVQAVQQIIQPRYYWPKQRRDIQQFIRSCHECQIRQKIRLEKPLQISKSAFVFEKIYIDVMHMPLAQGYRYIVAAKDDLSGTTEAIPLRNANAKSLANFFWQHLYCRYGAPQIVVTDNGPEVKEAFEKLVKRLGINRVRILPYNHHANGVVERGHHILRESLIKTCQGRIQDWPSRLAEVVFADRITVNQTTKFSPYQLLHAAEPILPLELVEYTFLAGGYRSKMTTEELLSVRARQIAKHPADVKKAAKSMERARLRAKDQFEKRFAKRLVQQQFDKGDLILVRNTAIELSHDRKHKPRYLGPYKIAKRTIAGNYELEELDGTPLQLRYAAFRILPYITRDEALGRKSDPDDQTSGSESDTSNESELESG